MGRSVFRKGLWLSLVLVLTLVNLPGAGLVASAADDGSTSSHGSVVPTAGARTIPYFSDSFTYNSATYPYTMVGTDPFTSTATTTVPVVIVPLRFDFADGSVFDPGTAIDNVLDSPLFQTASFTSGNTQYGDAIRRAMFWQSVAGTGYHVLLGKPSVLPTQTLKVPASQGVVVQPGQPIGPPALGLHAKPRTGVVSLQWFGNERIAGAFDTVLDKLDVDPTALVIVVSRNVALSTSPIPYGSPVAGFHTALSKVNGHGVQKIQTAIWAEYNDPYAVVEFPNLLNNTDVLSHEISEWLHDPFVSNVVPTWMSPLPLSRYFYGCDNLLETGDAVSDSAFKMNGYQLQDEAFFSWFAKQPTSIGINGQYSYLGALTQPSPVC